MQLRAILKSLGLGTPSEGPPYLRLFLYSLVGCRGPGFLERVAFRNLDEITEIHGTEHVVPIVQSLEWAVANPQFNFRKMLPGISYSNEELLAYLKMNLEKLQAPPDQGSDPFDETERV